MRVCVLGSGSKGNCTYIECGDTGILIDAGLSCAQIEKRLKAINVNPYSIKAVLITHEHSDHIAGAPAFALKFGARVYTHKDTWNAMNSKFANLAYSQMIDICTPNFEINNINISCFDLSHDAAHCLGYTLAYRNNKISLATDLGFMTDNILSNLIGSDIVVLEANHDVNKLINNPNYPLYLKNRILSRQGHLNNNDTANTIVQMLGYNVRGVILAHLSEQNNSPVLATNTVHSALSKAGATVNKDIIVDVAHQEKVGNIFKIKE
ncbi:MAG: MBL fold metallo-hydrolase [Clostridia bacterium]|nr:MBL fold metallo-hydrolase [Clostridia bacterium]